MTRVWGLISVVALLFLAAVPAISATIAIIEPESASSGAIIQVDGEFLLDDDRAFRKLALQFDNAVVVFSSSGGNLSAGLGIGKAIRLRQYQTLVLPNSTCTSACALAWLGGVRRYMPEGARIGFHAAYTDDNGKLQESGIANALVGSYLNQIGLPENAVAYVTHAPPQSIQWLNAIDAQQNGIYVEVGSGGASLSPKQESQTPLQEQPTPPSIQPAEVKVVYGIDLFGHDLPNMPLKGLGWNRCVLACSGSSECRAFTYNSKSDTCFLKSSADLAVHYQPATSGFAESLESQIRDSRLNILQRIDVVGNDYAHIDDSSMESCVRRCDGDPSCKAFTYIPKKTQCWLKSVAGKTVKRVGVVSGIK